MTAAPIKKASELHQLLDTLADQAVELTDGARACIVMFGGAFGTGPEPRAGFAAYLQQRPENERRLMSGEVVCLTTVRDTALVSGTLTDLMPVSAGDSGTPVRAPITSLLLVPLAHQNRLEGVMCMAFSGAQSASQEEVSRLKQLCHEAAPRVAMVREIESLREQNAELRAVADRAAELHGELEMMERELAVRRIANARARLTIHHIAGIAQVFVSEVSRGSGADLANLKDLTRKLSESIKSHWRVENEPFHPEPLDLRTLCRSAMAEVRPTAYQHSIRMRDRLPDETLAVMGVSSALSRVFQYLMTNAVRFADPGGEIVVEWSRDPVRQEVHITVSDTGVGIPPEVLEKVYNRYVSAEPEGEGDRGAGYPAIQHIVRLHGGKIEVTSNVGQISHFKVMLPEHQPLSARSLSGEGGHAA